MVANSYEPAVTAVFDNWSGPTASSEIFAVVIALSAILAVVTFAFEIFAVVTALSAICAFEIVPVISAAAILPPKVSKDISFKFVPSEYEANIFAAFKVKPVPLAVLIVKFVGATTAEQSKI